MRKLTLALSLLTFVSLSTACSKDVTQQKLRISANDSMDAEQLAQAGEQLVAPHTFMLADKVLDMALSKDPKNIRALFYKNFLKAPMTLKGALTRLNPFVAKYGDMNQFKSWQNQIPYSPGRDFLFDGAEDLNTTTDVQNVVVQFRKGLEDFRKFIKSNLDINLVINLNPSLFQNILQDDLSQFCVIKENTPTSVFVECDYRPLLQRQVNAADMIALSQVVTAQILEVTVYTNYSAEGVTELAIKESQSGEMGPAQKQAFLENFSGWGKLRNDHNFGLFTEFGADLSAAWKYVVANQQTLCPDEPPTSTDPYAPHFPNRKKRQGNLFDMGLCSGMVEPQAQQLLGILDTALQGVMPMTLPTQQGSRVFQVDAFHATKNPVQDLRSVMPASFDNCGNVTAFRDKTLGGTLPNGDADLFLGASCN